MSERPPNSPADLIRALHRLAPRNEATRDAIANLLGHRRREEPEPTPGGGIVIQPPPEPPGPADGPRPGTALPEAGSPAGIEAAAGIRLEPLSGDAPVPPAWLSSVTPLEQTASGAAPPRVPGLFRSAWRRAVLSTALSTVRPRGGLDLDPVLRALGRGEALKKVPRRLVPTLARGTQLLLDRGEGMLPFEADLERLEREVLRIAGSGVGQVLGFSGCPWDAAGSGVRRLWQHYAPVHTPAPGTRVLVASDLGIGRVEGAAPFDRSAWLAFARHLSQAGCPLLALVPYPPGRWPRGLTRHFDILHWDRRTTAGRVARLIRRHQTPGGGL